MRLWVLLLISIIVLTRCLFIRSAILLLTVDISSDNLLSFNSELLAEFQAWILSFESFHHFHRVLHKLIPSFFFDWTRLLASFLALNVKLDLSLPLALLLDLPLFSALDLLHLCQSHLLDFLYLALFDHLQLTLNLATLLKVALNLLVTIDLALGIQCL